MSEKPYIVDGERVSHEEYKKIKYEDLRIRVPKGKKDLIKTFAEQRGESINGLINHLLDEAMNSNSN